ncbi:MAG TPA: class I adenylate-forming enzyme family protein [Sumerlaeia bacterium]|nr:class I adenylate-forming enzyme family protein [Sumerlaeia bacterium]
MAEQRARQVADILERNTERALFVDVRNDEETTYGALLDASRRMASFLKERGVQPGDPVVISSENCAEYAALTFACMHVGARIVPINPAFHPQDFAGILGMASGRLFFTTPGIRSRVEETLSALPALETVCFRPSVEPAKKKHEHLVNLDFQEALAGHKPANLNLADQDDETVFLTMFTSGTTSAPKGINVTYRGLVGNGLAFCRRMGLGRENRFYNVLPMTYLGGFYNLMLIPFLAEGSFALDGAFGVPNVYGFWETVREYKVNTLWYTPTMLSMLLSLEDDEDLSFLKTSISIALVGMAPLPVDLKKRFEKRFGFPLYENYGLSETTFLTTNHPDLPYKDGSIGTALEGVTVKIVDEQGRPVGARREGQVLAKTPHFMKGYESAGESDRANVLDTGEFLTGDIGYLDEDGELFVTGRIKDIIIRGGVNISPKAIENAFYGMEAVEEVAVLGVPHPVYGEEVALVVRVKESEKTKVTVDDLHRYCESHIAHFQRPKLIYIIDALPKGATGKIQKNVLRKLIAEKVDPLNG